MRIKAITPVGTFLGVEVPDEQKGLTEAFLGRINELNSFQVETEEGEIFLAKGVIQNSVFVLMD